MELLPQFSDAALPLHPTTGWRDVVRDALNNPNPGRCSPDMMAHAANAARFRRLAAHEVQHLARQLYKTGEAAGRGETAWMTALLCRMLCLESRPRSLRLLANTPETATIATAINDHFAVILRDAETAGGHLEFDFSLPADGNVHEFQRLWSRCDPHEPVTAAIVPAYVVDKTRMSHQIVFTGSN